MAYDDDHIIPIARLDVEQLEREMKELGAEMEELQRMAYESAFAAMQDFLSGFGGWCEERGVPASTITPSGDEGADFLNMLRATRSMAEEILAAAARVRQ